MQVYIMSGVSGSGKSTAAKMLRDQDSSCIVSFVSADNYFGNTPEDYKQNFSVDKLSNAHSQCKQNFLSDLSPYSNVGAIFVDNTNTTALEMSFYIEAALAYGCEVTVVRVHADVEACIARNVHGVPESAIRAQAERFEKNTKESWPYHWQQLEVIEVDNRAK